MWNIKIPLMGINLTTLVMVLWNTMIVFYTETIDGIVFKSNGFSRQMDFPAKTIKRVQDAACFGDVFRAITYLLSWRT